jgi:hypothetical protein
LSCLSIIHAVAGRTFPAGERGSAAGSLLSSHYPNCTWACVLCRPSPELPFHFVWFLGWSTRHLALDPSSVLYLQHKLCSYFDALQHLPPPQPVPRQLLPLRYIQLTQPRLYTSHLLAFHCFLGTATPARPAAWFIGYASRDSRRVEAGVPQTARKGCPRRYKNTYAPRHLGLLPEPAPLSSARVLIHGDRLDSGMRFDRIYPPLLV